MQPRRLGNEQNFSVASTDTKMTYQYRDLEQQEGIKRRGEGGGCGDVTMKISAGASELPAHNMGAQEMLPVP